MGCKQYGNLVICSSDLERKIIGRTKRRWCFKCRKYLIHNKVLLTEILKYDEQGNLINGYYEPQVVFECRGCGEDHLRMWD